MAGKKGMKQPPWTEERKRKHRIARWGEKPKPIVPGSNIMTDQLTEKPIG